MRTCDVCRCADRIDTVLLDDGVLDGRHNIMKALGGVVLSESSFVIVCRRLHGCHTMLANEVVTSNDETEASHSYAQTNTCGGGRRIAALGRRTVPMLQKPTSACYYRGFLSAPWLKVSRNEADSRQVKGLQVQRLLLPSARNQSMWECGP